MGEDVSRWMYAMVGRLIYEVGEKDGWQVVPFLKGAASSGKSTILTRVCRGLYEPADVGTLSNNIERKFGLSALADKLIFIGPEIKSDIALEQAEFQSIVSGESVQVTFSHGEPFLSGWGLYRAHPEQKLDQKTGGTQRESYDSIARLRAGLVEISRSGFLGSYLRGPLATGSIPPLFVHARSSASRS